jgi:hypothetical protein
MNNFIRKHTAKLFICLLLTGVACKNEEPEQEPCPGTTLPVLGTCVAKAPNGSLTYNDTTGAYTYKTKGGGMVIWDSISVQIRHEDYPSFKYELWGGLVVNGEPRFSYIFENLNGKHIKNKIGSNRTIVFPDGAKVTLAALSDTLPVLTLSIYEGADSYRFNLTCNRTLEHSLANECVTEALDKAEADGEAGSFEIYPTGLMFFNLYTEDTPGNRVENRYNLGELVRDNPNNVRDYFDDPRLAHT